MIINKLKEKSAPDYSKMSSYINIFLKTEITCIPKLLKTYIGDYYNNALFNGATWVFVLWCVLHIVFDKLVDAFLKKLRYKEYVRLRLKNSLWYLGFYGTAVVYSGATLSQNEVELFNFKRMHVPSSSNLPSQVVIGYTLISTFFLHSSLWEGLAKECFLSMFSYLFLFLFLISSYILRVVEISFTLTTLIGIAEVAVEFTRCCFMSTTQDSLLSKLTLSLIYFTAFAIYFGVFFIIIPLTFIVPLGLKIMSDYPNILLLFLFFNLVSWLMLQIYQSVLFKFMDHWFYHNKKIDETNIDEIEERDGLQHCSTGLVECSLFKPRDDISYNLRIIKKEIKARQAKMMSKRKPKMLQTLKCMVAIKRKLNEKRRSESSESDSQKSEGRNLILNDSFSEDNQEATNNQDEESDEDTVVQDISEQESGKNEDSDFEEKSSQDSSTETEKELNIDDSNCNIIPKLSVEISEENNNSADSSQCEGSKNELFVKESESVETETHIKGNTKEVQIVKEDGDTENQNENVTSLIHDDNEKVVVDSVKNEDNHNNNLVLVGDNLLEVSKEKGESESKPEETKLSTQVNAIEKN